MSEKEWTFEDCVKRDFHRWEFWTTSGGHRAFYIDGQCKDCKATVHNSHMHGVERPPEVTA